MPRFTNKIRTKQQIITTLILKHWRQIVINLLHLFRFLTINKRQMADQFNKIMFINQFFQTRLIIFLSAMIDLDQLRPDWNLAEAHSKATKPGKNTENVKEAQRCPCCFRVIEKEPIGVCQNSKELQFLGFGFPLYFKFLKYVIIMVILQIVSYNAIALYWSYQENIPFCKDSKPRIIHQITYQCTGFFVSIARIEQHINTPEKIVRISSFVLQLLALIYIRDKITKANNYYDEISTTMSDYSIIIKDLPPVPKIQEKMRKMFYSFFSTPIKIEQMVVIGHLKEFYIHIHEKKKLIEKKKIALNRKQVDQSQIEAIDYQIQQNQKHTEQQIEKQINQATQDSLVCQKIIITLETDPIKEQVISQFTASRKDKSQIQRLKQILDDQEVHNIVVMQAPEPNQILWEHININRRQRLVRQILGWLIAIFLIAIITLALYFLLELKAKILAQANGDKQSSAHELKIQGLFIVYAFIFAIAILNKFVIAPVLHFIAHFQKHPTKDKEEYSFAFKYTLCLFFTTALVTLIVEDVTLHNIYAHEYGVVEQESIMFFVNSLFIPLLWLINPWYLYRIIRRRIKAGKQELTQQEANQIMQDVPVSIGKWYGQIIETIWFTYFYATLIPVGAVVTLIGLICRYWVDKYNLLHKTSIYSSISGKMCLRALKLLEITLIMRPVGSLIIDFQIKSQVTTESIVCAAVALVFIIMPMDKILHALHGEQFILEPSPYQYVKDKFISNYKTLHPIIAHKKILLQSELSNLNFYSFNNKLKKKLSKKVSMAIQMAALSPQKRSQRSIKEVLI